MKNALEAVASAILLPASDEHTGEVRVERVINTGMPNIKTINNQCSHFVQEWSFIRMVVYGVMMSASMYFGLNPAEFRISFKLAFCLRIVHDLKGKMCTYLCYCNQLIICN